MFIVGMECGMCEILIYYRGDDEHELFCGMVLYQLLNVYQHLTGICHIYLQGPLSLSLSLSLGAIIP